MTYLGAIVIGSAGAYSLSAISELRTFAIALSTLAAVWLATSAMAFIAIKKRRMDLRFAYQGVERFTTIAWLCWTIPLLITEVLFAWTRIAIKAY